LDDEHVREDEADLGRVHIVAIGNSNNRHCEREKSAENILSIMVSFGLRKIYGKVTRPGADPTSVD
jgi:hypothetical protein